MKPKPMVYQPKREVGLLYNDIFEGYHYYILTLGTHPTAYIEIPKNNILYGKHYERIYNMGIYLPVNGGLTYSNNHLWISESTVMRESWFIGWDYAHYGDYYGADETMPEELKMKGKKWTTEEIIEECKNAIYDLKQQLEVINSHGQ